MTDDEKFVRDAWANLGALPALAYTAAIYGGDWSAAAAFTRKRQQEIAFIEAEIDLVCGTRLEGAGVDASRWDRILARLHRERDELKRGVR